MCVRVFFVKVELPHVNVLSKVQLVQKPHPADVKRATAALVQVRDLVKQRLPNYGNVMQQDLFDVLGMCVTKSPRTLGQRLATRTGEAAIVTTG